VTAVWRDRIWQRVRPREGRGRIVTWAFFAVFLVTGLAIFKDYGISWDEPVSRINGMVTIKHLGALFAPAWIAQNPELMNYPPLDVYQDRDYGVVFEAPTALLEYASKMKDMRRVYFLRHLLTFLVCFAGVVAFYRIAFRRFRDWRIALLGTIFLVASPRLFAESFYNDKDAVFMALMVVGLNTSVAFLLRPTLVTAVVHAFACALAIDQRIMGVLLPAATCCVFAISLVKREYKLRAAVLQLLAYGVVCCCFVVLFWPYLWANPWANFVQAFMNMAKFRWDLPVLYLGEAIRATRLPWHYLIVWVGLTTPLMYIACFMIGSATTLRTMVASRFGIWRNDDEKQDLLFLGMTKVPIVTVIVLQSVLYDGWRQMYFIYPALLLVSLRGWCAIFLWHATFASTLQWRRSVLLATSTLLVFTASWMVRNHPFQNVYFNVLAGINLRSVFELDYWGLSNRRALEMILASDSAERITVWSGIGTPLANSLLVLKPAQQKRLNITGGDSPGSADYVLTNYRWDRTAQLDLQRDYVLAHQIVVGGEIINSVYKLRKP
jgi:hypothetical protein